MRRLMAGTGIVALAVSVACGDEDPEPTGNTCNDTCATAANGICEDGSPGSMTDTCPLGTDCADCGPRYPVVFGGGTGGGPLTPTGGTGATTATGGTGAAPPGTMTDAELGAAHCESTYAKAAGLPCGNNMDAIDMCLSAAESLLVEFDATCVDLYQAFQRCTISDRATMTCTADNSPVWVGCEPEEQALDVCWI